MSSIGGFLQENENDIQDFIPNVDNVSLGDIFGGAGQSSSSNTTTTTTETKTVTPVWLYPVIAIGIFIAIVCALFSSK